MADKRSRNFSFVLFNDDTLYNEQMDIVKENNTCWIVHNRDYDIETGEIIKAHTHVIVKFNDAKTCLAVAKYFHLYDINGKPVAGKVTLLNKEKRHNLEGAFRYLIHLENPEKHLYSIEEINGRLKGEALEVIDKADGLTSEKKLCVLFDYISDYDGFLSFTDVMRYARDNNMLKTFTHSCRAFELAVKDHNNILASKKSS